MILRFSLGLLVAFCLFLAPEASAQTWRPTCIGVTHASTLTPLEVVAQDGKGGCTWRGNDGATYSSDSDAIGEIVGVLDRATTWLNANGFRTAPLDADARGVYILNIVPAAKHGMCFVVDGEETCLPAITSGVELATAPITGQTWLVASSDASGDEALWPALNGLMLSTLFAYDGFELDGLTPGTWLSRGIPSGFAGWWLGMREDRGFAYGFDAATERFGDTLPTGASQEEYGAGVRTGILWNWMAGWTDPDGFAYARGVIEAVEGAAQAGTDPVAAVDDALEERWGGAMWQSPASGLTGALGNYAKWQDRHQVAADEETFVVPEGPTLTRRIVAQAPMSVVRVPVRIPRTDDELQGFTVTIKDAPESLYWGSTNLNMLNATIYPNFSSWESNTLTACPEPGPACEFDLMFVNGHRTDSELSPTVSYTVEVQAGRKCLFPYEATGMSYVMSVGTGRQKQQLARMDLDLPTYGHGRGAVTKVEGEFALSVPGQNIGTKMDLTATLACSDGAFRIENLRLDGPLADNEMVGSAIARGPQVELPDDAEVGTRLDDVAHIMNASLDGERAMVIYARMSGLEITEITSRRIEGVNNEVRVYKIEGRTTGRLQMDGDAITAAVDNKGEEIREGMDTEVEGTTARARLRNAIEQMDSGTSTEPITIYYSPLYGAVETVTGSGAETATMKLSEVRMEELK